ncbi:hypothetical protein Hte_007984 [Hypoxylon texense]
MSTLNSYTMPTLNNYESFHSRRLFNRLIPRSADFLLPIPFNSNNPNNPNIYNNFNKCSIINRQLPLYQTGFHFEQSSKPYATAIEQIPDWFMGLTYQDLTLELYLRDASAVEPPRYLLVDMVTMVGPAPIIGTQEHRAWMLNRYSYWIPFTKFVAEYQVIEPSDIPKLIDLVQLFTNHSMLDPVFVYECFAFALYWCPMISQTGVEVARLRNMMFHLHRYGLILNGPLTPTR